MKIDNYKKIVNKFTTGIAVVTGSYNNKPFGITINSFCSLSLNPILVTFNIEKKSRTNALIKQANYYNINILSNLQKDLVWHFAQTSDDKFKGINYDIDEHNIPIFMDNIALLKTQKYKIIDIGDHNIIIAKVFNGKSNINRKPLIYYNSKIK
jgi:flavin reductase (DIM6/NTAB) family NADH-FMN oxidoreductase RutF